jgi:hypothetical protein
MMCILPALICRATNETESGKTKADAEMESSFLLGKEMQAVCMQQYTGILIYSFLC